MPRDITNDMATEFSGGGVTPALLGEFNFDSGTIGMWTGIGTITWNGIDFLGGGNLIGVSPIEETQDLEAKGLVVSLNGISSTLVALSLTEELKNRTFRLYLAGVNDQTLAITDEPYRIFSGLMDTIEFTDNGETANIRLRLENILYIGQRSKIARYTDEEQRKRFPGDKGLEFINRLQDREIVW